MTPKQIKLAEAAARAFTRLADRAAAAEESVDDAIEALKVLIADESDDTDPTTYREFGYAWETAQEVAGKVKGALNRAQAAVGELYDEADDHPGILAVCEAAEGALATADAALAVLAVESRVNRVEAGPHHLSGLRTLRDRFGNVAGDADDAALLLDDPDAAPVD
jgi:hypothetical protein